MKRSLLFLVIVALAPLAVPVARAQVCTGYPYQVVPYSYSYSAPSSPGEMGCWAEG